MLALNQCFLSNCGVKLWNGLESELKSCCIMYRFSIHVLKKSVCILMI